jgi:hypothetical protein
MDEKDYTWRLEPRTCETAVAMLAAQVIVADHRSG